MYALAPKPVLSPLIAMNKVRLRYLLTSFGGILTSRTARAFFESHRPTAQRRVHEKLEGSENLQDNTRSRGRNSFILLVLQQSHSFS